MRRDRGVPGLGHAGDLARFREAAAPGQVEHDDAGRLGLEIVAEGVSIGQRLGGADPGLGVAGVFAEVLDVVEAERVLVPVGVELGEALGQLLRHGQAPERMELDHDVHLVADRLPDLAEGLQRRVQLLRADVPAGGAFGGDVEGPDLHAGDALLQQGVRQFVGPVEEAFEILIGAALLADMPVRDLLGAGVADVFVARAGVVGADRVAGPAAERDRDRLADRLAVDVPEREVDRGVAARLDARAAPAEIIVEAGVAGLDLQRVLADQLGRDALMQIGLDRGRAHEGLAEADEPVIGVQAHPDEVAELGEADGFEGGDLHRWSGIWWFGGRGSGVILGLDPRIS